MLPDTGRPYAGPADLDALLALLSGRPPARWDDFPGAADLHEMLGVADIRAATRLWANPAGDVAGFTILETDEEEARLIFETAPEAAAEGLDARLLDWAVAGLRAAAAAPRSLSTACREDHAARRALLEQRGFREAEHALHLARPLDAPIPEPRWPAGFSLRRGIGAEEAEAWVALHRAAFGTEHMTVEYRLAMLAAPAYDPALDLAAAAPDGTLAAYVVCSAGEENARSGRRDGWTDPVATHPAYRRLGLARALLLTGLRLLRERGLDTARLGTTGDNEAVRRTAEAVGYRLEGRTLFYRLAL